MVVVSLLAFFAYCKPALWALGCCPPHPILLTWGGGRALRPTRPTLPHLWGGWQYIYGYGYVIDIVVMNATTRYNIYIYIYPYMYTVGVYINIYIYGYIYIYNIYIGVSMALDVLDYNCIFV